MAGWLQDGADGGLVRSCSDLLLYVGTEDLRWVPCTTPSFSHQNGEGFAREGHIVVVGAYIQLQLTSLRMASRRVLRLLVFSHENDFGTQPNHLQRY